MSYGENPHYVKLPIFSEFMENSTKFMKNSDLTKWTQNLRLGRVKKSVSERSEVVYDYFLFFFTKSKKDSFFNASP